MEHASPNPDAAFPGLYRFGDVEVDVAAHTLKRGGEPCAIEPKAFAVLLALLRRPGELVGHDELLDGVWGHRHVTPGVLTRAIAQLRGALGDDSHHPRYIQTRHALGYSFIGELLPDREAPAEEPEAVPQGLPAAGDVVPAGSGAVPEEPGEEKSHHWPFRWWVVASVVAMAVAGGMFVKGWLGNGPAATEPTVAVMPFANLGPDRDTDYFAQGLAVEMHAALAGVDGLKVAALVDPDVGGERESDVRELGRRLGVATVLDASIRRDGDRLRINARLSDTRSGYTLWSHSYERAVTDVFATQDEIAREVVLSLLGSVQFDRSAMAKRLAPTSNYAAFDSYLHGRWVLQHAVGGEDAERAIGFFNDALEKDAGFARAQVAICRSERWRFVNVRDAGAYERALAACRRAAEMDPGLAQVDFELGELARAKGDVSTARGHYEKAGMDPSLLPDVHVGLAAVAADEGRQTEVIGHFERALALRPGDAFIYGRMGYHQYLAGRLAEAIVSYRRAAELRPGDEGLWGTLGGLHLAMGEHEAARQAFDRSIAIRPTDAALSNYGELHLLEGDYAAAADLYRRALAIDDADFRVWGNLGNALRAQPAARGQARIAYAEAMRRAEQYLAVNASDAEAVAMLGWFTSNLGGQENARTLAAKAAGLDPANAEVALINAQTLADSGDADGAREQLALARRLGISETRIASNPFFHEAPENGGEAAHAPPPGLDPPPRQGHSQERQR